MKWVNFLHIYQPPTQSKEVIDKVVSESYALLPELMRRHPDLRLSMSISGSLLELLDKYGHAGVIESYRKLAKAGRIELVGSAMYHPLMPLITPAMMRRQIKQNDLVLKRYFGDSYATKGFYFPEMAYSRTAGEMVKELGFEWTILDDIHVAGDIEQHLRYRILDSGLTVCFRNREFSRTFPPEFIMRNLKRAPDPLITAHDGELYGHWHADDGGFYEKAFSSPDIETLTVSEYLASLKEEKVVKLRKASWESTKDELEAKVPFALWNAPGNVIHRKLWALAYTAEKTVMAHDGDPHFGRALGTLDKGFASCAWWWGSGRKLGPFSPISWSPLDIEKGAGMLLESVRTLKDIPVAERLKIEKMFSSLRDAVWSIHWNHQYK